MAEPNAEPAAGEPTAAGPTAAEPTAERAWLVVIDMQRVFADGPWGTPGFADLIEPIGRLVAAYDGRVVFTRFVAPARPEGSWVDYYQQWPFALQPADSPLWHLVPPWQDAGRAAVAEPTFSKWGPQLAAAVGGSDRLVLCGVSTDCCVLSTALAAADAGMHVRVVRDACAGLDAASHDRALAAMALYTPQIALSTVDEELARG